MSKLSSIRVKDLSFQYNLEKQVFDNVSFLISPGEKVALMGKNGAGKSTLCQILTSEIDDYEGEVSIPAGVKIAYAQQSMEEQYMHWTLRDFLLEAKNLRESLHQYFLLLDLMAIDSSMKYEETAKNFLNVEECMKNFDQFLYSINIPEIQVSEECAVELMCLLEEDNEHDEQFLKQALKFLKKCPDGELSLSLDNFVDRFKVYYKFLLKRHQYQSYAKEHFAEEMMELLGTLQEQYEHAGAYKLEEEIREVLELVGLDSLDQSTRIEMLSGGQKGRLILAQSILKNPDILILDEPTNNLDVDSYERLKKFVKNFKNTLIVISHDAEFLNTFVQKVLYVDSDILGVREYSGTYEEVKKEVEEQMKRERSARAKIDRELKKKKDVYAKRSQQAQVYGSSNLGRAAQQLKKSIEELEDQKQTGIKEDKAIGAFLIPCEVYDQSTVAIDYMSKWDGEVSHDIHFSYQVPKSGCILISGENGMGKSYYLKNLIAYAKSLQLQGTEVLPRVMEGSAEGMDKKSWLYKKIRIGYYSQDFATLNYEHSVQQSMEAIHEFRYQDMRSILARFLFTEKQLDQKVGDLSEGQKALLSWARLMFLEPNVLILDEPTNHIYFRHLPIIKDMLKKYRGTVILVCHDNNFVADLPIAQVLDLNTEKKYKWKDWKKLKNL